jgi:hypothetical protein
MSMLEVMWNVYLMNYHYNHRCFHSTKKEIEIVRLSSI